MNRASSSPASAAPDATPACRNCGALASGAYCPACGQETQARLPRFTQFMREAAGRYVALDGRLWKTLGALMFRPGFLTREYLAGRRRRYVRPARLFLVASLLLFAVLRIVAEVRGVDVLRFDPLEPEAAVSKGPAAKSEAVAPAKPAAEDERASEKDDRREKDHALDGDFDVDLGIEIPALKKRLERFRRLPGPEKEAQIVDGIFRFGPYAMFALLPAFALLLKALYLGRRRRYPARPRLYSEHLVFAAHNHAFVAFAIIAATLASFGLLRTAAIVWILVYLVWSMRAVYGGSWLGIAARAFVIFIAYSILFGLVTAGLVVAAVVLR